MQVVFHAFLCMLIAVSAWLPRHRQYRSHGRKLVFAPRLSTRLHSAPPMVDISPTDDNFLLKSVLRKGDMHKDKPATKDTVEIAWKIRDQMGNLLHDSSAKSTTDVATTPAPITHNSSANAIYEVEDEEAFDFQVGAEPRQVILGWEHAVRTMHEGELASLIICPQLAFGSKGAPPIIPPDTTLHCELELLKITPAVSRRFKSVGVNESIHDELVEKLESGDSPVSAAVMHTDKRAAYGKSTSTTVSSEQLDGPLSGDSTDDRAPKQAGTEAKVFDPTKHMLDEKLRVQGTGAGHLWTETKYALDVEIPLTALHSEGRRISKADLEVSIRHDSVYVGLRGYIPPATPLLQGALHGRVSVPDCSWALLEYSDVEGFRRQAAQYVLLSLEKGYGSRDIWASVLRSVESES